MSASAKPRLAGRQPSNRGGVPRVRTWPSARCGLGKRGFSAEEAMTLAPVEPVCTVPATVGSRLTVPLVDGTRVPYANLDHAASAPCLEAVQDAVDELLPWYASVHRGAGFASQVSTKVYERAREVLRRFVNAHRGDTVIFTRNTTDALNLLARALPS